MQRGVAAALEVKTGSKKSVYDYQGRSTNWV